MSYICIIYYFYLLTYLLLLFPVEYPIPVVLPGGYPGNKLPGYGSPSRVRMQTRFNEAVRGTVYCWIRIRISFNPLTPTAAMCTAIKHPVPDRVKPSFVIFDIRTL